MWKQKIGMSLGDSFGMPIDIIIHMLKEIGFDAISPNWYGYENLEMVVNEAKKCELAIQSLHAPFSKMDSLWKNNERTEEIKKRLLTNVEACHDFNIAYRYSI